MENFEDNLSYLNRKEVSIKIPFEMFEEATSYMETKQLIRNYQNALISENYEACSVYQKECDKRKFKITIT